MPRSSATCAIRRPLSSANRTPRSSNSSGYFLGLDMTAEDLLSPGHHPRIEVPAKPGPAHWKRLAPERSRTQKLGAGEVGAPELGVREVGPREVGPEEVRTDCASFHPQALIG